MRNSVWLLFACLVQSAGPAQADGPRRVMSLNLCTDQLLLWLADERQIASLSWLASDPDDSAMADQASAYAVNYGSAEELIRLDPDLVIAGEFTATYTVNVARRLGYPVTQLPPANSIAQIEENLRTLGAALSQEARAEHIIADMQERLRPFPVRQQHNAVPAVLIRAGGFTAGESSLANELMTRAGFHNVAAQVGLDEWGSLSLETLVTSGVDVLVLASYRDESPSLANSALAHPAMQTLLKRLKTRTVPGNLLACGGPQSVRAVELMAMQRGPGRW